jgi:putative transposase
MDMYSRKIVGWSIKPILARDLVWDNVVAESFLSSLKVERVRRKINQARDKARADLFDYVEMFYNPRRRHSHIGGVSYEVFERASNHDL